MTNIDQDHPAIPIDKIAIPIIAKSNDQSKKTIPVPDTMLKIDPIRIRTALIIFAASNNIILPTITKNIGKKYTSLAIFPFVFSIQIPPLRC